MPADQAIATKRTLCGADTRSGGSCGRPAGWGTPTPGYGPCKFHGGCTPSVQKGSTHAMVTHELRHMGLGKQIEIEPTEAMLVCVRTAAGWLAYIAARVAQVDEAAVIEGGVVNIWVRLQQEATDRLSRVAEAALRQGIAERRVQMAERAGSYIAQALEDALADIDLPAGQRARVARAFATRLAVLEATEPQTIEGVAS